MITLLLLTIISCNYSILHDNTQEDHETGDRMPVAFSKKHSIPRTVLAKLLLKQAANQPFKMWHFVLILSSAQSLAASSP